VRWIGGPIWVEEDLSVPDRPELFVIGDLIAKTRTGGRCRRGAAGRQSGRTPQEVLLSVLGQTRRTVRYVDKGSMATIGRHKALGSLGGSTSPAWVAWWLWLTVHLLSRSAPSRLSC